MSNLKIKKTGPGYCHFPNKNGYNNQYFEGLTAEKLVTRYKQGVPYRVWKKVRKRNEPLDLRVYNTAALEILNPNLEIDYSQVVFQQKRPKRRKVVSKGVKV